METQRNLEHYNMIHESFSVSRSVQKCLLLIINYRTSDPPELHYNASLYEAENIKDDTKLGPQVIHKYNIKNEGPFTVEESEIYFMWPYQTLEGEISKAIKPITASSA